MKKYIIRFNANKVLSVMPIDDGSELFSISQILITSLEKAKLMFAPLGIDTEVLDAYQEPEE